MKRVVPKDLFNDSSLLKLMGNMWIRMSVLYNDKEMEKMYHHFKTHEPFCILQDESDGSTYVGNIHVKNKSGLLLKISRPMNSLDHALYASNTLDVDTDEIFVFEKDGSLTKEFIVLLET